MTKYLIENTETQQWFRPGYGYKTIYSFSGQPAGSMPCLIDGWTSNAHDALSFDNPEDAGKLITACVLLWAKHIAR